ncbi:YheC/YheD family endospore coat-associated protein [Thermoflavimicrobium dichotomicum]|uniref:Glutathione synthase/RimK-type ligase, ATP-grasp superfamily n=1 Tax=Thermoflavimicrobium dichotomicum TaxID=46223 RepID=A0A1I3LE09_9BACL|nr:YheC/YheD family protein [Thermoflavimicrobium dichotomicum]SFI83019.1 Glutathione synthase/RimK-type ligase, ATP-grasp superfamily [Thermoflavimicrobium dichotomicum]
MGQSRVQIQIMPERHFPVHSNITISRFLARKLGIKSHMIPIVFGSTSEMGSFDFHQRKNAIICISQQLASQLKITNQPAIYAHFDPKVPRLKLGPLLGILINPPPAENKDSVFGSMTRFLEECAHYGLAQGIRVAIFFPENIWVDKNSMIGWIHEKGKWKQTVLPLPDVIYNRITSRKVEQQENLQQKLKNLRYIYQIPIFNEMFLNKWQVHQILNKDEKMQQMLPETAPFTFSKLKEMFSRYSTLYLKPTNGSLGVGIIRLIRSQGKIIYQSATPNGTITRVTRTIHGIIRHLQRKVKNSSYLIQQGLHLATYEGRPVDFRVLVQKNRHGRWTMTSAVGRIANSQHIVSNLAKGGTLRKASDLLKELKHISNKPSLFHLKSTSLEVAQIFETLAEGHFAELGIDLAIDQKGKIWLLEINSKPSKTDDSIMSPSTSTRPSVYRLIEYTHYLTGLRGNSLSKARTKSATLTLQRRTSI